MKRRVGFVSNSSSSSFCLYGFSVDFGKIETMLKPNEEMRKTIINCAVEEFEWNCQGTWIDAFNYIVNKSGYYDLFDLLGIGGTMATEEEIAFIGNSFEDLGDNETGAEFKKRTHDEIATLFNLDDVSLSILCEVIYG